MDNKIKYLEAQAKNWRHSYEYLVKDYTITRKELLRYMDMWFKLRDFVEDKTKEDVLMSSGHSKQIFVEMQSLEKADGKEKQHEKNFKKIAKKEVPQRKIKGDEK
jgi:hypothetical protein